MGGDGGTPYLRQSFILTLATGKWTASFNASFLKISCRFHVALSTPTHFQSCFRCSLRQNAHLLLIFHPHVFLLFSFSRTPPAGSISGRSEMVKTKGSAASAASAEVDAKLEAIRSRWRTCTLSQLPLAAPVVCDDLGHLFNKDGLLEAMLQKALPARLSHIRGLRDVFNVTLKFADAADGKKDAAGGDADNAVAHFACPVTMLPANGRNRFVATRGCGCVLSERAVREVPSATCLVCGGPLTTTAVASSSEPSVASSSSPPSVSFVVLCPADDEEDEMRSAMEARRAAEPKKEKRKKAAVASDSDEKASSSSSASTVASSSSAAGGADAAPVNKYVKTAVGSSQSFSSDVMRVQQEAMETVAKKLKASAVASSLFHAPGQAAADAQLRR
jgi:hypothetical protein